MKPFALTVGIFLTLFLSQCHFVMGEICYEIPDPIHPQRRVPVPCRIDSPEISKRYTTPNAQGSFGVNTTCKGVPDAECDKAIKAFEYAAQILNSYIKFNSVVVVNATYAPFCGILGKCSEADNNTLGSAGPAFEISRRDDDGIHRNYPQALVKELNLDKGLSLSRFDINARFNAEMPWWFQGDPAIGPNQYDLVQVSLHEFIHGLGFLSLWQNYTEGSPLLTPLLRKTELENGTVIFEGFTETVYDKFLVKVKGLERITAFTAELNKIVGRPGTRFSSLDALYKRLLSSTQYKVIGNAMLQLATTEKSLGLLLDKKSCETDVFIVETSIQPFSSASSISHCDSKTYNNTTDFLMTWRATPGIVITTTGDGPLGPKTLKVLENFGYKLAK